MRSCSQCCSCQSAGDEQKPVVNIGFEEAERHRGKKTETETLREIQERGDAFSLQQRSAHASGRTTQRGTGTAL